MFWRATERLREAETLAQLAEKVSGPADAPPKPGAEEPWFADYTKRARAALKKASTWVYAKKRSVRERAMRIASRVGTAASNLYRSGLAKADAVKKKLKSLAQTARTILGAGMLGFVGATWVLPAVALLWFFTRKEKHAHG